MAIRYYRNTSSLSPKQLGLFGGLTATVGAIVIVATLAAGTPIAFEPETGTLSSGATVTTVTGQSGSGTVKFAAAATPTPTPSGANNCPAYPATPDANCTGPTTALTLYTGSTNFTTPGQVIQNVEIRADGVVVNADNVTFRNVKFVQTGPYDDNAFTFIHLPQGADNVVFEDCEVDGRDVASRGIYGGGDNLTVRRCEIHHTGNAIEVWDHFTVIDNYIHDIHTPDGLDWHADGIQSAETVHDITIKHNTILLTGGETGAINIIGNGSADTMTNILIENNLFAGGGYTIYAGQATTTNYKVINNRFSTRYYPKVGQYNIWYPNGLNDFIRTGNVIHETGAPANENL